ncbi:neuronal acetylcholine receptor subunit alpha-2-like [Apostichopus japonicus]|uniref:neuronal acetylcholine receptor subunit alpha-2-like n=1 Tax=Stichopus japonicus TaxID=307972 RepID=UPI003AB7063E
MFIERAYVTRILLRLFIAYFLPSIVVCRNISHHPQKQLARDIIGAYGPMSVRPVWDHDSTSTVVFFKLLIAQVVEFNERKQQITLNGWMKQEWQDDFLSWDPADYGDISSLTLTGDEIWFPDTTLYENIDPGFLHTSPSSVTFVNSSGLVSWSTPIIIQSSCRVKVKYFPFDTQICTLTFGSWTMDGSKLQMRISHTQDPRETVFYDNGVWSFKSFHGSEISKKFACCDNAFEFVEFNLTLTRQSDFYLYNVIIPCCMLCLVNLMVFWMPSQSGEKMAFVVSNLLAAILFQQLVGSIMPPLGDEVPVLSLFFLLQVTLSCLVIVGTTLVLRVYHYHGNKPIPPWLYKLTLKLYWGDQPYGGSHLSWEATESLDNSEDMNMQLNPSLREGAIGSETARKDRQTSAKVTVTWNEVSILLDRLLFIISVIISISITIFVSVAYIV